MFVFRSRLKRFSPEYIYVCFGLKKFHNDSYNLHDWYNGIIETNIAAVSSNDIQTVDNEKSETIQLGYITLTQRTYIIRNLN